MVIPAGWVFSRAVPHGLCRTEDYLNPPSEPRGGFRRLSPDWLQDLQYGIGIDSIDRQIADSTAMCLFNPKADEEELAWRLRKASGSATPNRLIVSYTDQLLGRNGRMVRAIDKIGRGADAFEGKPFFLNVDG